MKRSLLVMLCCAVLIAPAWAAERGDPQADCAARLKTLGRICLLYAEDNKGQMPPSLAELYYRAYVNDFKAFVCPAQPTEILSRGEIDAKSGYVLSPGTGSGVRPVVQDRSAENHGGAGVNVFYSDGAVRWEATGKGSIPVPGKGDESKPPAPAEPEIKVPLGGGASLGLTLRALGLGDPLLKNLPIPGGLVIEGIEPGGAAAKWGLKLGDILVKFGDKALAQAGDLNQIIAGAQPNSTAPILIFRDGKPDLAMAALGDLPALLAAKPIEPAPPLGATIAEGSVVTEVTLCLGTDEKGEPIQPGVRFPASAAKIACRIAYKNAPANTDVAVGWYRGEKLQARSLGVIQGAGRLVSYVYTSQGEPFRTGRYRVEITVGGKPEATAQFVME